MIKSFFSIIRPDRVGDGKLWYLDIAEMNLLFLFGNTFTKTNF